MNRLRRGFSLIEMLVVIAIIGILMGVTMPKVRTFRASSQMRSAKGQLASSISTARAAAMQKGRTATFHAGSNRLLVTVITDTSHTSGSILTGALTVVSSIPLDDRYGVTLTVRSAPDSVLDYDARGFGATGSNGMAIYVLTGNGLTDSVCVSARGLIMKNGCGV